MSPQTILLEACVDSLAAAVAAEQHGAQRLELCMGLEMGGLTPSLALVELVCQQVGIPVQVLLRPRPGNFVYTDGEFATVLHDAEYLSEMGISGIVAGFLQSDGHLDVDKMTKLQAVSKVPLTFHRAFDHCVDPLAQARQLAELGVERILTSGQQATALAGAELIAELVRNYGDRVTIMPGGGVSARNIAELANRTGAREFHFSALRREEEAKHGPHLGKGGADNYHLVPDPDKVARIQAAIAD